MEFGRTSAFFLCACSDENDACAKHHGKHRHKFEVKEDMAEYPLMKYIKTEDSNPKIPNIIKRTTGFLIHFVSMCLSTVSTVAQVSAANNENNIHNMSF